MKALLAAVLLPLAAAAPVQAQEVTVTYDEFGQMSDEQKLDVFNEVSAENRALLVRTQAERWLALHRTRLSEEQVSVVEEAIAFTQPELYDDADREAEEAASEDLMARLMALLSREDMMHAFTRRGAYIPPAASE